MERKYEVPHFRKLFACVQTSPKDCLIPNMELMADTGGSDT